MLQYGRLGIPGSRHIEAQGELTMKSQVEKVQAKDPKGLDALMNFYASQK